MNRGWLLTALVLSCLLLAGQLTALDQYLYWRFWWFDILMHALGGAVFGAIALAVGIRHPSRYWLFLGAVVVGWEVFEYVNGISTAQPNFAFDTGLDIVLGLVGAAIAYMIARPRA
jgi:hypothetical protein